MEPLSRQVRRKLERQRVKHERHLRKCRKLGTTPIVLSIGDPFRRSYNPPKGRKPKDRILFSVVRNGRELVKHATKGWRNNNVAR